MSYIGTTEIGGMFFGSTEIEKAYLGNTLVYEKAGEIPGSLITDYVQSGLVLHLDGKEKGSTTYWVDRIGNRSFEKRGGVTFNKDHVYFDGVDDWLRYYNGANVSNVPGRNTGTIEVVYENENLGVASSAIFLTNGASKIIAYVNSSKEFVYTNDTVDSRAVYPPIITSSKASISVSADRAYENGTALSIGSTKRRLNDTIANYWCVGHSKSGYYFKGKIYSIRIYNRKLSQAEVMQNLSVDNLRFNLGLTL